jgi:hypothetical protein
MSEIKSGPELDRAVAVAVGFRRVIQVGPKPDFKSPLLDSRPAELVEIWADDERMPAKIIPKYSTDLNAAFAAAEKAGLFETSREVFLIRDRRSPFMWEVHWVPPFQPKLPLVQGDYVEASTPALAICAAILKLKDDKHE